MPLECQPVCAQSFRLEGAIGDHVLSGLVLPIKAEPARRCITHKERPGMYAPDSDSIICWRGTRVYRWPQPARYVVYLVHFHTPYFHARHYIGATACLDSRLRLHRAGRGSKLMKAVVGSGIDFTLARLWQVPSWDVARTLERRLKARHDGPGLCPICAGRPFDALVSFRQGHWPISLFATPGRRRTMTTNPRFARRVGSPFPNMNSQKRK